MGFLERVQADIIKPRSLKLSPLLPLSKRNRDTYKAGPASGKSGEQVGFTKLTETRKLTPMIEKELATTDPFNFQNETWAKFTKNVAPKLLVALMLDMNIVPKHRKAEFSRYLERKLRSLAK
jgi:hypothetical protein